MQVSKVAIWISCGTLIVMLVGILPAYVVFFDKPDLVYEMLVENIPLPKDLPGQLPDNLAIVTVQNIGRRPSTDLQGSIAIGGDLIEYQVRGPNPAFGQVSYSRDGARLLFTCPRLASGGYPIKVLAWYRGANTEPDVGVSDALGAARRVTSIAAETTSYKEVGNGLLGLLVGLLGSFTLIGSLLERRRVRKSIGAAARGIANELINRPAQEEVGRAQDREARRYFDPTA